MSEADFYHSIGVSKQNWYSYSWGLWQPNIEMKIKIATALGCDSCLIWQEKKSNG
jgi:DNA-binding XRE family transcriptional regulator